MAVFAYTALRRAELRNLRVEDVEFDRRRLHIPYGKGGKSRFVFLAPELESQLKKLIGTRQGGYLFAHEDGRPLSLRTINNIVASVAKRAGITTPNPRYKNVTPHLLRHSFARNWKRASGSLESLQKILGHASFSTTMDLYGTESLDETGSNYCRVIHRLFG